jgi:hypothetical protein
LGAIIYLVPGNEFKNVLDGQQLRITLCRPVVGQDGLGRVDHGGVGAAQQMVGVDDDVDAPRSSSSSVTVL